MLHLTVATRRTLQVIGLIGLTVGAYWPSLSGGFVWDDLMLVKQNLIVTGELNGFTIWGRTDFPLSVWATWMQHLAFGENPLGYRLVNLGLHLGSALLLWRVVARLGLPGGWAAALLFALHPIAVTSVAWISELKNTLSLPCYLASLLAYLRSEERRASGMSGAARWNYLGALFWFGLALSAKTSTVILPVTLILCRWWQRRDWQRADWLRLIPFLALAAGSGLLTIWFQQQHAIREVVVQTEGGSGRLFGAARAIWFYLEKILLPVDLCLIYPRWSLQAPGFSEWTALAGLGLSAGLFWKFRRQPLARAVLLGGGAFVLNALPILGLVDMYFLIFSRVSDHLIYLPMIPLLVLIAALWSQLPQTRWRYSAGWIGIGGLTLLTWQRAGVFASDAALWRDTVAKNPHSWTAHNNLACNLAERGELATAIQHWQRSLELNPANGSAHQNLGKALALHQQNEQAEVHLRTATELQPGNAETRATYAQWLADQRRWTEAAHEMEASLTAKPTTAHRRLRANWLAAGGQIPAAQAEYARVLAEAPDDVEALNNLAWLLCAASERDIRNAHQALKLAGRAIELTQEQAAPPWTTRGAAYAELGDFPNAIAATQRARALAQQAGDAALDQRAQRLLKLYESGRTARGVPPDAPTN